MMSFKDGYMNKKLTEDDYKTKNAIRRLVSKIAMHIDPDVEVKKIRFDKEK